MALTLVAISFPWIEKTDLAHTLVQAVRKYGEVMAITSLFKRRTEGGTDFDASIEFALSVDTTLEAKDFSEILLEISGTLPRLRKDSRIKIRLLFYENKVLMTPDLTLPHPDLQYDLLTLRLSGEIWGRHEHPILKQTLGELADQRTHNLDVEFIMQGQKLID